MKASLLAGALALSLSALLVNGCESTIHEVARFTLGDETYQKLKPKEIPNVSIQRRYILEFAQNKPLVEASRQLKTKQASQGVKTLKEFASEGNGYAQYLLYEYYSKKGQKKEAQLYKEQAIASNNYQALLDKLLESKKKGDVQETAQDALNLAIIGDLNCQILTGFNYLYGNGLPTMHQEGLDWLHRVADLNTETYQCNQNEVAATEKAIGEASALLTEIYDGDLFEGQYEDKEKYVKYLQQAALYGVVKKQFELAMIYERSDRAKTRVNAGKLYKRILENKDNQKEEIYPAVAYAYADYLEDSNGSPSQIKRYMKIASDKGFANNYTKVGELFFNKLKYDKAREFCLKASAQNNMGSADYGLAIMYHKGLGVAKDLAQARSYYEQAIAKGHLSAAVNLGKMYEHGDGVSVDKDKALGLYNQVCAKGEIEGCESSKKLRGVGIR